MMGSWRCDEPMLASPSCFQAWLSFSMSSDISETEVGGLQRLGRPTQDIMLLCLLPFRCWCPRKGVHTQRETNIFFLDL